MGDVTAPMLTGGLANDNQSNLNINVLSLIKVFDYLWAGEGNVTAPMLIGGYADDNQRATLIRVSPQIKVLI